jgi:GNAT superfamily N-acetyltransferase
MRKPFSKKRGAMGEIQIRDAIAEDHLSLLEFQLCTAAETEGVCLDRATVSEGVRAVLNDPSKGRYLMAEEDGRPIGCLLIVPEWSDWRNGAVLWLHSVYVVPEKRRQGVLARMYQHLREMVASSPELHGIRALVDRRNRRGQLIATKLGMDAEHYVTYEWLKRV